MRTQLRFEGFLYQAGRIPQDFESMSSYAPSFFPPSVLQLPLTLAKILLAVDQLDPRWSKRESSLLAEQALPKLKRAEFVGLSLSLHELQVVIEVNGEQLPSLMTLSVHHSDYCLSH